jgi:hypothetical protein
LLPAKLQKEHAVGHGRNYTQTKEYVLFREFKCVLLRRSCRISTGLPGFKMVPRRCNKLRSQVVRLETFRATSVEGDLQAAKPK